jgi:hypothetical protein
LASTKWRFSPRLAIPLAASRLCFQIVTNLTIVVGWLLRSFDRPHRPPFCEGSTARERMPSSQHDSLGGRGSRGRLCRNDGCGVASESGNGAARATSRLCKRVSSLGAVDLPSVDRTANLGGLPAMRTISPGDCAGARRRCQKPEGKRNLRPRPAT